MSVSMLKKTMQIITGAGLGVALTVGAAVTASAQPWQPIDNTSRNNSVLVDVHSAEGSCHGVLINPVTALAEPGCVSSDSSGGTVYTTTGTGDSATFTVSTPFPEIQFPVLHLSGPLLDPELTPDYPPLEPAPLPTPPSSDGNNGINVGTNAPGRLR